MEKGYFDHAPISITPHDYKLKIELVPEKAWGHNPRSLMPRGQWDKIKGAVFDLAGDRCEICCGRGYDHPVECHERWNFNEEMRLQTLEGLIALCPRCHAAKHLGFSMMAKTPKSYDAVRSHMARVNDVSAFENDKYIAWAFAQQAKRRGLSWVMDVRWLERHFQFAWSKSALESKVLIRGDSMR